MHNNKFNLILKTIKATLWAALIVFSLTLHAQSDNLITIINILKSTSHLTGNDLANIISPLHVGTERDQALLIGIKLVETSDIQSDIANINIAYQTKVEVATALLQKTPAFNAFDLSLVSNLIVNTLSRDEIILNGLKIIEHINIDDLITLLKLTTNDKINISFLGFSKIIQPTSVQLGILLKTISDGPTRDRIIEKTISAIEIFDGNGAALIVDRSFETKLQTAAKLIQLIPNASGSDLDKMLAVCGSGNTRDLILTNAIKLLNKLTKTEAISLYSRAYANKESVALLLMSKVDDIDGQTIGDIALLSTKNSTRDLIITEGLKRLNKLDAPGLIAMLNVSTKLRERLVLIEVDRIIDFTPDDALIITKSIADTELQDKFLIHSIDLIKNLDEPTITLLALAANTQSSREEIVRKGIEKMGDAE
jgi:hypothetical protein